LGKLLIAALDTVAKEVGCYKCILDCDPRNTGFYEKCGYEKSGQEMSHYFEAKRTDYMRG
jgi:glucosamine-phosphate N-acetyltransferase